MGYGLFGREPKFFEMFKAQAGNLLRASGVLHQICIAKSPELADPLWAKDLIELEVEGDKLAKKIYETKVFIIPRPFEREDIRPLVKTIDDVLDFIEEAVKKLVKYRVVGDPTLNDMMLVVRESLSCVYEGICFLPNIKDVHLEKAAEKMTDCEHRADRLEDAMIDDSYEIDVAKVTGKEPPGILTIEDEQKIEDAKNFKRKRRELAEIFEKAVDKASDIFHIIGNMKLKNA